MPSSRGPFTLGIYVYALGSFAAGIFDLVWRSFDPAHQPLQAWGNNIPGAAVFACIIGVGLVAAAVALLWRRSERAAGLVLAAIYLLFALFWLPRFYTAPHYFGSHIAIYVGMFSGTGSQIIASAAGVLIWTPAAERRWAVPVMRRIFGVCVIGFGLGHLTDIKDNLMFVPHWLPAPADYWVIFTGVCFVLSGLALLTRILDVLAAWLLGLMFLGFNLTILPTFILAHPGNHAAWGGNAYNLAAVGSSWILAAVILSSKKAQ